MYTLQLIVFEKITGSSLYSTTFNDTQSLLKGLISIEIQQKSFNKVSKFLSNHQPPRLPSPLANH